MYFTSSLIWSLCHRILCHKQFKRHTKIGVDIPQSRIWTVGHCSFDHFQYFGYPEIYVCLGEWINKLYNLADSKATFTKWASGFIFCVCVITKEFII